METVTNIVNDVTNWPFLNEPMWKWFIFLFALALMIYAQNGILSFL